MPPEKGDWSLVTRSPWAAKASRLCWCWSRWNMKCDELAVNCLNCEEAALFCRDIQRHQEHCQLLLGCLWDYEKTLKHHIIPGLKRKHLVLGTRIRCPSHSKSWTSSAYNCPRLFNTPQFYTSISRLRWSSCSFLSSLRHRPDLLRPLPRCHTPGPLSCRFH